jgi:hypothetical protein
MLAAVLVSDVPDHHGMPNFIGSTPVTPSA